MGAEPKRRLREFARIHIEVKCVAYMGTGLTGHERVTKVVLAVLIIFDVLPFEVSAASSE